MPHRQLTQAGMNRVVWKMLKALGGTFTISNRELDIIDPNIAVRVDHQASTDTFKFTLQRLNDIVKDKNKIIIAPDFN